MCRRRRQLECGKTQVQYITVSYHRSISMHQSFVIRHRESSHRIPLIHSSIFMHCIHSGSGGSEMFTCTHTRHILPILTLIQADLPVVFCAQMDTANSADCGVGGLRCGGCGLPCDLIRRGRTTYCTVLYNAASVRAVKLI